MLPEKIRNRKDKIGFETPQNEWFKKPVWKTFASEILNSKSFKDRRIVDQGEATKTLYSHYSGKVDASNEIWKWMHLEMWFREFID
jgi:asparagine synthase (glutamine-hydrolysing)